ncbi:MAG: hypothetical protein Q9200_005059 [Gallowayella weberi]
MSAPTTDSEPEKVWTDAEITSILLAHTHSPADISQYQTKLLEFERLLQARSSEALDLYLECTSSDDSTHLNHLQDAFHQQEQKIGVWIKAAETLGMIRMIARVFPEVWRIIYEEILSTWNG